MSPDAVLRELIARAGEGDDVALAQLFQSTQDDIWRLCTSLGSWGEIEDLVQETYLQIARSAASFRGDSPARAWLLAIARNVCADHVRRRQRQRSLFDRITERWSERDIPPPADPLPWLDTLTPERREAFVLTQILDLSYEDAAAMLDCPIGTIRSRVHRAREDLLRAAQDPPAASSAG